MNVFRHNNFSVKQSIFHLYLNDVVLKNKDVEVEKIRLFCNEKFNKININLELILIKDFHTSDTEEIAETVYQILKSDSIENEILFSEEYVAKDQLQDDPLHHEMYPREPEIILSSEEEDLREPLFLSSGPRTKKMDDFLINLPNYSEITKTFTINGKIYTPFTGMSIDTFTKNTISCGSSVDREMIILDAENSSLLKEHFNKLLAVIKNIDSKDDIAILTSITRYIKKEIFDKTENLIKNVEEFSKTYAALNPANTIGYKGNYIPLIPIDAFIKERIGVCRHHALVTNYMIDGLIKKTILKGDVKAIRDNLDRGGGHIWNVFLSTDGKKFIIDAMWGLVKEINECSAESLNQYYGAECMRRQSIRLLNGIIVAQKNKIEKVVREDLNNESSKKIIKEQGKALQERCFLLRRSKTPGAYAIHYYDLNSATDKALRLKINPNGKLEAQSAQSCEIFNDFEALKQALGLTKQL